MENIYSSKICRGLDNIPEAAMIRTVVFIEEQGFENEFDETDKYAYHAVIFCNGAPSAAGRMYSDENGSFHIGRIAVMQEFRRNGLGRMIVELLEDKIAELGGKTVVLSAQTRVKGFYEAMGYVTCGDEYLDEFCPHILMKKTIKPAVKHC